MLLVPRYYQEEAVGALYSFFQSHSGNPIIAMPTGTGKSVVIAMFLESIFRYYPNQKIIVLTHVKELIEQNYQKLLQLWPAAPAGVNSAALNKREVHQRIIFAGIASVYKTASVFGKVDLLIVDECHLLSPNDETMYQAFIADLLRINPNLKVIGLTATPWRLGQGHIIDKERGSIFTDMAYDLTGLDAFNKLIAEGYLSPLIPKRTQALLDVDGVHMRGGEFIPSELQKAVDKDEVTEAALREVLECAGDRKHWLIFASGVEHTKNVTAMLNAMGVSAVAVHSKMKDSERDEALLAHKQGRYRAVVNNNILTTGYDFPGIDLIVVLRPTASPVLWVQMLGRGTRPVYADGYDLMTVEGRLAAIEAGPKQNCLVLDFANNSKRLGPINDPVLPRKKGEKKGEAPVKLCEQCATWNHASARYCIGCGHEFKMVTKISMSASTNELIKGETPVVEVFRVDHITYSLHQKMGAPDMVKVSYYCGLRMFTDYVCVEHDKFAGRKARQWWAQRTSSPMPATTAEALEVAATLKPATDLRVWINKKYPEILAYCFDGTGFGTREATGPGPEVQTSIPLKVLKYVEDDDIPF